MKKLVYAVLLLGMLVTTFSVAQAQMVRQRGILGALGIETPAMQSARQQTRVALQLRQDAEELNGATVLAQERSEAAQGATEDMLGVVRSELKSSIEEVKNQAVTAAKAEEEARKLLEQANTMKKEAEKAMAEAKSMKAEAEKVKADAVTAQSEAAQATQLAETLKEQTAKKVEELTALRKVYDEEKAALDLEKKKHEEEKEKIRKELEQHLSSLKATPSNEEQPQVVEEQ